MDKTLPIATASAELYRAYYTGLDTGRVHLDHGYFFFFFFFFFFLSSH